MVRMPQVGRPVYVTLGLATLTLVVIYGGMAIWPRIETYRRMQELDRDRRDRSLSAARRVKAAEMLAEFGPEAAPYMLEAARDDEGRVREKAYAYLAGLEPASPEAMEICLAALKEDRDVRARASVAVALGSLAYGERRAHPDRRRRIIAALGEAGDDASATIRLAVVRALAGANATDVDMGRWLGDPDRSVRLSAAEAMFWLDPAGKGRMVPVLQSVILQSGPERPGDVLRALGLLFRADRSACRGLVPTFVNWLGREDAEVRGRVAIWLADLGPLARDAAPALEAMLDRGRPIDRARAAFAVIAVDPSGCDRAAACLLALLADAAVPPRERGLALPPFDAMFRNAGVPAPLRAATLKDIRTIHDQPGIHPELALRIRELVEFHERPRPSRDDPHPGPGPIPAARLISAH